MSKPIFLNETVVVREADGLEYLLSCTPHGVDVRDKRKYIPCRELHPATAVRVYERVVVENKHRHHSIAAHLLLRGGHRACQLLPQLLLLLGWQWVDRCCTDAACDGHVSNADRRLQQPVVPCNDPSHVKVA